MTLILSLATPSYVIQVSDRVLTWPDRTIAKNNANKTVVYNSWMAFSFTELAVLRGKPTDLWLAETLAQLPANCTFESMMSHIAHHASVELSKVQVSNKALAFVGVGYVTMKDSLCPVICRISNFHGPDSKPLPAINAQFSAQRRFYREPGSWGRFSTGVELDEATERVLLQLMLTKCSRRPIGQQPIVRLLVECIRAVASRDSRVSKDVLVSAIPRTAAQYDDVALLLNPLTGVGMFMGDRKYVNEQGIIDRELYQNAGMLFQYIAEGTLHPKQHSPIFVGRSGIMQCEPPSPAGSRT